MTTISVGLSGSAITGLTGTPTKTYTVSDSDLQLLLNWAAVSYASILPANPTNQQILMAWIQAWINNTIHSVQVANMASPPPLSIV